MHEHLTDKQIDFNLNFLRQTVTEHSVAGPRIWDSTIAAVIVQAKQEERRRIEHMCNNYRARLYADFRNREATKPARDALAWVVAKLRQRTAWEADHV